MAHPSTLWFSAIAAKCFPPSCGLCAGVYIRLPRTVIAPAFNTYVCIGAFSLRTSFWLSRLRLSVFSFPLFELIFVRIYCSIGIINSGTVRCDMVRNNVSICPVCGENLKPYDKILRIACTKGRKILWKWGLQENFKAFQRANERCARTMCGAVNRPRVLRRKPRPERRDGEIGLLGSVCRVHSCAKKRVNIRLRRTTLPGCTGATELFSVFLCNITQLNALAKKSM